MQDEMKLRRRRLSTVERSLRTLYASRILAALGNNMVTPFLKVYAVMIGASASDLGWFTSMSSLSSNVVQVFSGRLTDRLRRKIPIIALIGITSSLMWIIVAFTKSPETYIWLIIIRTLLVSAISPASMSLLGDLMPLGGRGVVMAHLSFWTNLGGLAATLISGALMTTLAENDIGLLTIPLLLAATLGTLSYGVLLTIKEPGKNNVNHRPLLDLRSLIADLNANSYFRSLCTTQSMYVFLMSIAWPVFPLTMAMILRASMFEVSMASIASIVSSMAAQRLVGGLCDRVGRKPLIALGRLFLTLYPIVYMLAPNVYVIMLANLIIAFPSALFSTALLVSLLDSTPEDIRGELVAFYNLSVGLSGFLGSLVGGVLADRLIAALGLWEGCAVVYGLSAAGRLFGAYLVHRRLEEPRVYPSTLKVELSNLLRGFRGGFKAKLRPIYKLYWRLRSS